MSNSFVYPSRAAEKTLFKEEFRNSYDVARNGGTLVGAPVVKDGVVLDGSTQYAIYAIPSALLAQEQISFVIEFVPDFNWDEDATRYLFRTSGVQYSIFKNNNAANNVLRLYLGGTSISLIPSATYSPYWKQGERNIIVISGTSGVNSAWLNGTLILTDGQTWTPGFSTTLAVGARFDGALKFAGTIKAFSAHARLPTQADVDAIESGRLWSYMNRTSVALDMKEATARAGTHSRLCRRCPTVLLATDTGQ